MDVDGTTSLVTLTISAGSVFRFGANSRLAVGYYENLGALMVDGTAAAPVLFTAHADAPQPGHWWGIHVHSSVKAPSRISHATIEYAGVEPSPDDPYFIGAGNLNILGSQGQESAFVVNDVIVQKSSHSGFVLVESGVFGTGSARLTSRDNGTYPITLEADSIASVPPDAVFSGNAINAVEIKSGYASKTQTWPQLSVPYLVTNPNLLVGTPKPFPATTLTIAPGTTIRFAPGTALWVGYGDRTGVLDARGTQAAPIRFIADSAPAPRGYWRGLHFWNAKGSKLDYVTIANGGDAIGSYYGTVGDGNVNVYTEIGAFVTNSTLSQAKGCAVTVSNQVTSNILAGNTANDNGQNKQCLLKAAVE
ncbi:hypothetical protein ACN28S_25905 [Cystobacter fuscus]